LTPPADLAPEQSAALARGAARIGDAARAGYPAVLAALEQALLDVGDPAVLLARTSFGWEPMSVSARALVPGFTAVLEDGDAPPAPPTDAEGAEVEAGVVVAVLLSAATADPARTLVIVARLALNAHRLTRATRASGSEVVAMRKVATRILAARELEEGLLAVTHEALALLESDMAGVFLCEDDEVVMQACTGNREVTTARLRMHRGQGLAGLVFSTGQAAKVDDYLHNDVISDDFHNLAIAESTRSALCAPLSLDGEVIGVLEVWRRRESVFTQAEIERLVGLADLAAIALHHARLYDEREASLREVEVAHRVLEKQFHKVTHALALQQELVQSLLDGERLTGIVRLVAQRTETSVALFDTDFDLLAGYPLSLDDTAIAGAARVAMRRTGTSGRATTWSDYDNQSLAVRPVFVGGEQLGWLCLLTAAPPGDDTVELALTQAGLTCALHHLEEQAAARARAAMRDEMLLSLLQGSPDERRAATSRAKHVNVDLRGELRACVCTFGRIEDIGEAEGWTAGHTEHVRRRLLAVCESALLATGWLRLAARHGDAVVALVKAAEPAELRDVLQSVAEELGKELPGLRAGWGVSAPRSNPMSLAEAYTEAWTATRALGRTAGRRVAIHEDLGILGLLLAGPGSMDLPRFVDETIGPALTYDRQHGTSLVDTLRTYLDADCSQQEAAARLFVHQKTVKYRLGQVQKLTGLDLRHHHDRLRADIAVRAADLT
jgi:sugar diacid utilization regulator/putative methionine-R-sulfoxide reductase with GAF domain